MAPPSIPELDDAADNYYDVMEERVSLTKDEDQAKDSLIGKMKEHQLDRYETASGKIVSVISSSKLKVKKKQEPKAIELTDSE